MTTSQGLGRRRPGHLAFQPWQNQFGIGAMGQDAGRTMAQELYYGGYPPPPVQIPMGWLRGPVRLRMDPPISRAEISQAGGTTTDTTDAPPRVLSASGGYGVNPAVGRAPNGIARGHPPARSRNPTTAVATGGREWVYTATIDSLIDVDPANFGAWVTDFLNGQLPRTAAFTLVLNGRPETEIWRILSVTQGTHISITGTPGAAVQLVGNPWMESGISGWTATGCTLAQSTTWSRSGSNSLRLTPDGVSANVFAEDVSRTVVPGANYTADGWLFSPTGYASAGISVNWYTASGGYVDTSAANAALTAGVSERRQTTWACPAGATIARVHPVMTGTPSGSNLLYADEVTLTGPTAHGWPTGATELVVEGITHSITADVRTVTWNTAPIVGAVAGVPGPWFYLDDSRLGGTDVVPF